LEESDSRLAGVDRLRTDPTWPRAKATYERVGARELLVDASDFGHVGEAGVVVEEGEVGLAGRAVAVLGDDDFGRAPLG
jgi:hypothetical protein